MSTTEPSDWSHEPRMDVILQRPEVRERLARATASAKKPSTLGRDFVDFVGELNFWSTFVPGVPAHDYTFANDDQLQWIAARLGVKCERHRSKQSAKPIGEAIVAVLCHLAEQNLTPAGGAQFETGCRIEAAIPADAHTFDGRLYISLLANAGGTGVDAGTNFTGQFNDRGRGDGILDALMGDL